MQGLSGPLAGSSSAASPRCLPLSTAAPSPQGVGVVLHGADEASADVQPVMRVVDLERLDATETLARPVELKVRGEGGGTGCFRLAVVCVVQNVQYVAMWRPLRLPAVGNEHDERRLVWALGIAASVGYAGPSAMQILPFSTVFGILMARSSVLACCVDTKESDPLCTCCHR